MKALDIATERADSKAKLESLVEADFRVRSLTAASCASFVSVRQPRQRWASICPTGGGRSLDSLQADRVRPAAPPEGCLILSNVFIVMESAVCSRSHKNA